jgi:hypothetical protein
MTSFGVRHSEFQSEYFDLIFGELIKSGPQSVRYLDLIQIGWSEMSSLWLQFVFDSFFMV